MHAPWGYRQNGFNWVKMVQHLLGAGDKVALYLHLAKQLNHWRTEHLDGMQVKNGPNPCSSSHKEVESSSPPLESRPCLVTYSDQINRTECMYLCKLQAIHPEALVSPSLLSDSVTLWWSPGWPSWEGDGTGDRDPKHVTSATQSPQPTWKLAANQQWPRWRCVEQQQCPAEPSLPQQRPESWWLSQAAKLSAVCSSATG